MLSLAQLSPSLLFSIVRSGGGGGPSLMLPDGLCSPLSLPIFLGSSNGRSYCLLWVFWSTLYSPMVSPLTDNCCQLWNFSSAWNLAIFQVGPQSGMILQQEPPTHCTTLENCVLCNLGSKYLFCFLVVCIGCLEDVCRVSGGYLKGALNVSRRFWKVSACWKKGFGEYKE